MAIDFNKGLKVNKDEYRVPGADINKIKEYVTITNLLDYYDLPVESETDDFFISCIWHEDKTPSLCIRPSRDYFHCFSCGAGGDVINFVKAKEGVAFKDAVKWLLDRFCADKVGNKIVGALVPEVKEEIKNKKYTRLWHQHLSNLWDIYNNCYIDLVRSNKLSCNAVLEDLYESVRDGYYSICNEFKDKKDEGLIFKWYKYAFGVALKEVEACVNALIITEEDVR